MSTQSLADLSVLMNAGVAEGLVTQSASNQVLSLAAGNLQIIQGAQGQHPDDINSTNVTPVLLIVDNSASMSPYQDDLIAAYNECLGKIARSSEADSVKMSVWKVESQPINYTNGFLSVPTLNGRNLAAAAADPQNKHAIQPATASVFNTNGGATALNDTVLQSAAGLLARMAQYEQAGCLGRAVLIIISDGEDNTSRHAEQEVKDLLAPAMQKEKLIPVFFGLGTATNFERVAAGYGIPKKNVKVATTVNARVLGELFNMVSAAVISTSQGFQPNLQQNPFLV